MKFNVIKKIFLDLTLDSSESVIFTQGGKHKIEITPDILFSNEKDLEQFKLEVSIQMERNDQGRFNFIYEEARKHHEKEGKLQKEENETQQT